MEDLQLIEFYEHPLKSKKNFSDALKVLAQSPLKDYMESFVLPQPGDHPAQFYSCQVVFDLMQANDNNNANTDNQSEATTPDHH